MAWPCSPTARCWPGHDSNGQLGNGTTDTSLTPVQVFGLGKGSGVIAISAGSNFSLALKSDGTVVAWGDNLFGKLGDGTTTIRLAPIQVACLGSGSGVVAIAAGFNHALALKSDGTVLGWGRNELGACGDGTSTNRSTPVQVSGLGGGSGVTAIAAGPNSSLALKSDGTVVGFGNNISGRSRSSAKPETRTTTRSPRMRTRR